MMSIPEVFLAVVLLCSSAPSQAQTQAPCKCDKVEQLKLTNVAATDKSGNAVGVSIDRMINGRTTLVAMYGAQFSCAKLPVSIEVDMADLKHVSTVTMVTDWYSKRHKVTQVEAEVVLDDQKAVWHAVSYDYHDNFQGKADLTCGNGLFIPNSGCQGLGCTQNPDGSWTWPFGYETYGGQRCCYPPKNCQGGMAGSFTNVSTSVVTKKLKITINEGHCNGNSVLIDEIIVWGNDPCCMDKCAKDCSGSDRGTCVPFGTVGVKNGDYNEGVKNHEFQCKCNSGYTGVDCSKKATCFEDAFELGVCELMGMVNSTTKTNALCELSQKESGHLFTAHKNVDCGVPTDKGIKNSDILDVFGKALGNTYTSLDDLIEKESANKNAIGKVITTKEKGLCNSGKMRLTDNEKNSAGGCYDHFWTFQCVPDCGKHCCEATTTTTTTTQTTTTTATTTTTITSTTTVTTTTATTTTTITTTTTTTVTSSSTSTSTSVSSTSSPSSTATTTITTTTYVLSSVVKAKMSYSDARDLRATLKSRIEKNALAYEESGKKYLPQVEYKIDDKGKYSVVVTVPGVDTSKAGKSKIAAMEKKLSSSVASVEDESDDASDGVQQGSAGQKGDNDSNTTVMIAIVIVALLILVAIIIATVVVTKNRAPKAVLVHQDNAFGPASFENPAYDTGPQQQYGNEAMYAEQTTNEAMYSEPSGANQSSGYMDVQPGHRGGNQNGTSGYMDVAPGVKPDEGEEI